MSLLITSSSSSPLSLEGNNSRNNKNSNAKTNHEVCIADQISFTACILLHSLPSSSSSSSTTYTTTKSTTNTTISQQPNQTMHDLSHCVLIDLITLLFDLSTIASSNVLLDTDSDNNDNENGESNTNNILYEHQKMQCDYENNNNNNNNNNSNDDNNNNTSSNQQLEKDEPTCMELLIFNEIISLVNKFSQQTKAKQEYCIELVSIDQLLSLQSGIFHLLFKYLVLQNERKHSDDYILEQHDTLSRNRNDTAEYDNQDGMQKRSARSSINLIDESTFFAPILGQNDIMSLIIASIRQVLAVNIELKVPLDDNNDDYNNNKHDPSITTILSLRNKVFASNLLLLLLPDLSIIAHQQGNTPSISSPLWFELMTIVVNSLQSHYKFLAMSLFPLLNQRTNPKSEFEKQKQVVRCLSIELSSMLVTLVSDIIICPMKPFSSNATTSTFAMWSIRSKIICNLFDCIHYIHPLMNSCEYNMSLPLIDSIKDLSKVTLRAIQITLFPNARTFDKNDNNTVTKLHIDEMNKYQQSEYEIMKLLIRDHCSVFHIFPVLFSLVRNPYIMTIALSIIVHLPSQDGGYASDKTLLSNACDLILSSEDSPIPKRREMESNKRRRIAIETDETFDIDEVSSTNYVDGSSFQMAFTDYIDTAFCEANDFISSSNNNMNAQSRIVENITSSICLIHLIMDSASCFKSLDGGISKILSALYEAATMFSQNISHLSYSDQPQDGVIENKVERHMDFLLKILTFEPFPLSSEGSNFSTGTSKSRSSLISTISKTAFLYWTNSSANKSGTSHQSTMSKIFNAVMTNHLPPKLVNQLKNQFSSYQNGCRKICCEIDALLGKADTEIGRCNCAFISEISPISPHQKYCMTSLIEERFSFKKR
jgi:hypothetical protein